MAVYELVAVSRVPQAAASPTLTELGPIVAPQISWTERLAGPGGLAFSTQPDRLADAIRQRLRDLAANPLEVWLYRDGTHVAASLVAGYQIQGQTLTVTAPSLLGYLAYMWVTSDLTFTATDQFTIAKNLVDHWQNLAYGHFGIDTAGVGTSGVTRDRVYEAAEHHNIGQRIAELAAVDNGFDVHVDAATRDLILSNPTRGSDLSGSVFLDGRNIVDAGVVASVAPGDVASEAFGTGTGPDDDPIVATKSNTALRQSFGRAGVAGTFDGVTVQATLDGHTQALLDARDAMLFTPGPGLIPVSGAEVGDFGPGDTVTYDFDAGLGAQTGAFRVAERLVEVDRDGTERISVAFL